MILNPTFDFKGVILPVMDNNDKFYFYIENRCDHKVLLNVVGKNVNKFVYIESGAFKFVNCGEFIPSLILKIFYMGNELLEFSTDEINKSVLISFSNFIFEKNTVFDKPEFEVFFDKKWIIKTKSSPQNFYLKIIDSGGFIIFEEVFFSESDFSIPIDQLYGCCLFVYTEKNEMVYSYKII